MAANRPLVLGRKAEWFATRSPFTGERPLQVWLVGRVYSVGTVDGVTAVISRRRDDKSVCEVGELVGITDDTGRRKWATAWVDHIENKSVQSLTEADANCHGFEALDDLLDDIAKHTQQPFSIRQPDRGRWPDHAMEYFLRLRLVIVTLTIEQVFPREELPCGGYR